MGIYSFSELETWQRAHELHRAICEACKCNPLKQRYRLVAQLKAAGSSAMANIAEGFERGSPDEFHKSLCIAKGEAGEILSHLIAAHDDGLLTDEQFQPLRDLALRVAQLIGALRRSLEPRLKKRKGH
jgi:four helix bundle protein